MLLVQVDWVAEFAELGMITPFDDYIAKETRLSWRTFPTFHTKWRGKQYYLPIETGVVALFYNTAIFKAAGLQGRPRPGPSTWRTARR